MAIQKWLISILSITFFLFLAACSQEQKMSVTPEKSSVAKSEVTGKTSGGGGTGGGGTGAEPYIKIHNKSLNRGRHETLRNDYNSLEALTFGRNKRRNWDNRISVIELFNGAEVTIFENPNYDNGKGKETFRTLGGSNYREINLKERNAGAWNNRISSIVLGRNGSGGGGNPPYIIVYKRNNFRGESRRINGDQRNLGRNWDNQISSIKVFNGAIVNLYDTANYRSTNQNPLNVDRNERYLQRDWNYGDITSSIQFQ